MSSRSRKREYRVELREDEKYGIHVLWKNRRYPVEIVRTKQNRYEILFNDIGHTFTVETPDFIAAQEAAWHRSRQEREQ